MMGLWAIVPDDDALKGRALEQRTVDPTDYRFPLAIYNPALARDLDRFTVSFDGREMRLEPSEAD